MRRYLIPISIFVTGLALGILGSFLLFGWDSPPNDVDSRDLSRGDVDSSSSSQDVRKISEPHRMAASLKDLSELRDAFQRNHQLYSMLASVDEDELASLLRQSNEIEQPNRREQIQMAIVHKLASTDPSRALRHIQELSSLSQSSLVYEVFQGWAASSLEDAVAEASSLPGSQRANALRAILETRSDLSDIDVRQIGRKLGNEALALKLNTANKVAELIEQPEQAWYFILNDETNDVVQEDLLREVAETWRDQEGFEVLARIQDANFTDSELRNSLVQAVVGLDPQGAFAYVQEFPQYERTVLSNVVATCWASSDPESALRRISTVESAALRESLLDSVFDTWAKSDPGALLDKIENISTNRRSTVIRNALRELALSAPHDAIRRLNEVEKYLGDDLYIVASIVEAWSRHDSAGAVEWILTVHDGDKKHRRDLLKWVLPRFVHENANKAFEIAHEHSDENDSKLEVDLIRALTDRGQVEIAQEMLPRLREDAKNIGYAVVGIAKVKDNEPEEVVRLAEELQGRDRGSYYVRVFHEWAQFDGVQLFERIQSFQSLHTRSLAASILIQNNQLNPVLNESQIESAWMHLTDADRVRVERAISRNR